MSVSAQGSFGNAASAPERQSLFGYLGCSVLLHLGGFASMWGAGAAYTLVAMLVPQCNREPIVQESIEVSMIALKTDKSVPDRAARVERTSGSETPTPEPPPVKESDLVIHEDEPPPDPGNVEDAAREELLAKIERQRMLMDMDAPDGTQDRNATDPDGEELANAVLSAGSRGDPEYARWYGEVQRLAKQHFRPITQGRTDLRVKVTIEVDQASGQILGWNVTSPSGVISFDAAAERAVQDLGSIPLPPAKYIPMLAGGVGVEFVSP